MPQSRPALIINTDSLGKLPLKIIAPITDWKDNYENYPWMIKITPTKQNCLSKISAVDCFQIRSVSIERFIDFIGSVESEIIAHSQEAITKIIGTL